MLNTWPAAPGSRALLTDLYQLTQAQGYFRSGLDRLEACFYLHFRDNPFKGGYTIACGMEQLVEIIAGFGFDADDCAYLAEVKSASGDPLFSTEFIDYLRRLEFSLDVAAVPEGSVIFPYEPLITVTGPILEAQLLETVMLNQVGFQSLIATKAARVCQAAEGPVAEFGLRRAQGPAGGIYASRAAIIGGCASTSNVEAGRLFDVPVSGTHAHSWVMAHPSELEAFRAFAQTMPEGCVLLVDTYDVAGGVANAITVAHEMESRGQRLAGIRIDSGDLAWLSKQARAQLDAAGLGYVKITASNDLDEYTIQSLHAQGACIDSWGVGTHLVTAYDQPALSAVYKLCAIRPPGQKSWRPVMKLSEQLLKNTLPGPLAVRRYSGPDGLFAGDMVYQSGFPPTADLIIDPMDELRRKTLPAGNYVELLEPLAKSGQIVWKPATVLQSQAATQQSLAKLDSSCQRFLSPHSYPVGLEHRLLDLRDHLRRQYRGIEAEADQ